MKQHLDSKLDLSLQHKRNGLGNDLEPLRRKSLVGMIEVLGTFQPPILYSDY